MMFGKKPVPRGGGEREGERERSRFTGFVMGNAGRRLRALGMPSVRFGKGLWRKPGAGPRGEPSGTRLPGRSDVKSV